MKVSIKHGGGYNPKLGPKHPDNQDPTLPPRVESFVEGNNLTRTVSMTGVGNMGMVKIIEVDDDENVVSCIGGDVTLDATKLWNLAVGIVELFGGRALRYDDLKDHESKLREKIFDVLVDNEARCLDDNVDRDMVLRELMKALTA